MTSFRSFLASAVLALTVPAGAALAQTTFSTPFDTGTGQGSFSSVALAGGTLVGTVNNDRYLSIGNNLGPATFDFTLGSATRFLLVQFAYGMTNGNVGMDVSVRNTGTNTAVSATQTRANVNTGTINPGLNPLVGNAFSWHFGVEGQPMAAGNYHLSIARTGSGGALLIDDVSVSAVPEPGTAALMALAGLGLAGAAARRRKAAGAQGVARAA